MNNKRIQDFVEGKWATDVMPTLIDYIAVPCVSPAFDPDWAVHGHMMEATTLLANWARQHLTEIEGIVVEIHQLPGRTPLISIEVPATSEEDDNSPVLIYGHLDKQPAMEGWSEGRSAWTAIYDGDRLYGRGGADDGYALFSAVLAILALADQKLRRPRCVILIEASEESSSEDLPYYFDHLAARLGSPSLVIALDSMCGNYDQLWTTSSLRGQVAGTLTVRVLDEAIHSGEASGIVPSSFRVATRLLSRIEDPVTGCITMPECVARVPDARLAEAGLAASILGPSIYEAMPFVVGARPTNQNVTSLLVDRSWRAQLAVTGVDGLPPVGAASSVMLPATSLKLSLRLPPTVDPDAAGQALKACLEDQPPYGAQVSFDIAFVSPGWHAPETAHWLAHALAAASLQAFGRHHAAFGGGGGIPFLPMLQKQFPDAQFVVTGVLGPQSNAHGPNEFLHIPAAQKVTMALAHILHAVPHG
ncbi:MAG: M20/M25/M40 family metallo-hydrolase [Proteobacteria bacterium]|nr:M20/M25/M40 family metallo-hydrolase [Pseudomonadota bacterium]